MGQNISITNHNGVLKIKRNRRKSQKASSSKENNISATSSTISNFQKSKAEESYQSSSIIVQDHEYIFPKPVSSASLDLRDLPYDTLKSEDDRMNANQFALKALFGGNYLEEVGNRINFESTDTKVLDIGCGSGGWVMCIRPANVSFIQHDATLGLPYEDNTFDLVHMRMFLIAFNKYQYADCMKEVLRVTKPNGIVQLLEVEMVDDGDELVKEFGAAVEKIMEANDQDALIAQKLSTIMSTYGFTPIQEVRKSFRLNNHPLASEFLYIFDISLDTLKRMVFAVYGLSTEEEYKHWKLKWLESRKNSSASTWWCAAGQKVVVAAN
ncbi:hypothetical protein MAM1_0255d08798 [Mucor ambiguus]|uniref:Methyltransferase type 11 domain-containing protein n=1 Tax=Mucor ambiguus TaxID=91626 RepID=A0A0C9N3Y2_9FUNG|nr:hypothetical protein MAM1_0255d08798 [Mucor ambiguus]